MYVERYGTGTNGYLGLHGWGGSHRTFAPLVPYLPEEAVLYSADLPGSGNSPEPREWSLKGISADIADTIRTVADRKVTIIGNCSGAILGLLAARQASDSIERFVLIDPFAYTPWYFKIFVQTSWGKYAYYSTFANPFGRWLTNLSLKRKRTKSSDLTRTFSAANHEATYRYLRLLSEMKEVGQFADLQMPIDIVYGERTFGAVRRSIDLWREVWPDLRCFELKGAGHLPIEEAPEQLSRILFSRAADEIKVDEIKEDAVPRLVAASVKE